MAYNENHSNSSKTRKCGKYVSYYTTDVDSLPKGRTGVDWDKCSGHTVEHKGFGPITINSREGDNLNITFNRTGNTISVHYASLLRGNLVDYDQPTVCGVGIKGSKNGVNVKTSKVYTAWNNMMIRCYSKTSPDYHRYGAKGVTVCDRWLKFDNFAEDVKSLDGYDQWINNKHYALDKDKKAVKGQTKIYSPETCCFLSFSENSKIRWNKVEVNTLAA